MNNETHSHGAENSIASMMASGRSVGPVQAATHEHKAGEFQSSFHKAIHTKVGKLADRAIKLKGYPNQVTKLRSMQNDLKSGKDFSQAHEDALKDTSQVAYKAHKDLQTKGDLRLSNDTDKVIDSITNHFNSKK